MKTIILDTSALISGLLKPSGAAGRLVEAFFAGDLGLAYTSEILAEYVGVLERKEFDFARSEQMAVVIKLRASGTLVIPQPIPGGNWPDPDDLPFVAAALATSEKIVVTFNPRDFAPAKAFGVRVVNPVEAIGLLNL